MELGAEPDIKIPRPIIFNVLAVAILSGQRAAAAAAGWEGSVTDSQLIIVPTLCNNNTAKNLPRLSKVKTV